MLKEAPEECCGTCRYANPLDEEGIKKAVQSILTLPRERSIDNPCTHCCMRRPNKSMLISKNDHPHTINFPEIKKEGTCWSPKLP